MIDISNDKIIDCSNLSYEEWLDIRVGGVGGSDVAAILGLSPWRSALQLFWEKVHPETVSKEQSQIQKMGHKLEPVIAELFQEEHPEWTITDLNSMVVGDNPWELANVDRLIEFEDGTTGILEIKTTSAYNKSDWKDDEVPEYYLTQLQWYMGILGVKVGWFACLIGGQEYVETEVEFDEEIFTMLQERVKSFWNNHVLSLTPPPVTTPKDGEYIGSIYPASSVIDNKESPAFLNIEDILVELDLIKQEKKNLDDRDAFLKGKVKESLKNYSCGETLRYKVKWNVSKGSSSIDTKLLKETRPDVYQQYLKVSEPIRRLTITKKKDS